MNFVLDCNVWVSIFYRNKLEKVLSAIYAAGNTFISCEEQLKEFADIHTKHTKIARMIPVSTEDCLLLIQEASEIFHPSKRFALIKIIKTTIWWIWRIKANPFWSAMTKTLTNFGN